MAAVGKDEVRKIWNDYFEDLYNMDTENGLESPCVALLMLEEVIILKESQLGAKVYM